MIKDQYEYLCTLNKTNLLELGWDKQSAKNIRNQCNLHNEILK